MERHRLDIEQVRHAIRTALYSFREYAETLDKAGPSPMMTAEAAARMAKEFRTYARDTEHLMRLLESAEFVEILHDEDCTEASCEFPTHTHHEED